MTIASGTQVRKRDAAADRRQHGARTRSRPCRSPSPPSPARTSSSRSPASGPSTRPTTTRPARWPCRWASPRSASPACGRPRRRPPSPATACRTCSPSTASPSTSPSSGSTQHALDGGEAQLVPCGPDAKGITLGAGPHVVETAVGHNPPCASTPTTCTGWNIDQLALDSAAGGGRAVRRRPRPRPARRSSRRPSRAPPRPSRRPPSTSTARAPRSPEPPQPFELVLGQSVTRAGRRWPARARGRAGRPRRRPRPAPAGRRVRQRLAGDARRTCTPSGAPTSRSTLTWTPQREVWAALAVSAATLLLCLVLGFLPRRARRWVRAHLPRRLRGPAGPEPPGTAGGALRRRGPGPARRPAAPRSSASGAGCASPGRCSSVPPAAASPRWSPRRWRGSSWPRWSSLGLLVPWARAIASVGAASPASSPGPSTWSRARTCTTTCPGSNWARLVRQRGQPDLARRRAPAGRRGDRRPRPAGQEAARGAASSGPLRPGEMRTDARPRRRSIIGIDG